MAELPSISIRKFIRWGEEAAGENTNTLVLTTRDKNYVDVRVYLPSNPGDPLPNDPNDATGIKNLEWAFAGKSKSTPAEYEAGELTKPAHTVWSHWVDSKTLEEVKDEGYMYPQPDGTTLEKGAMAHPETGLITKYEEVWQDLEPQPIGQCEDSVSYVLKLDEPTSEVKGVLIRIGEYIEGVLREKDSVSAIRWEWIFEKGSATGAWKRTLAIGGGKFPCEALFHDGEDTLGLGKSVSVQEGMQWVCIEAYKWS